MDASYSVIAVTAVALGAGLATRWRLERARARDTARHVEAERIIALLSGRQPGVWDQDDLRSRIETTARELYSVARPEDLEALAMWVAPALLAKARETWPAAAVRRESKLQFKGRPIFVQVHEGGAEADRVVARLLVQREARWLNAEGRVLKRERRRLGPSYHTWVHIDGQGWHLEAIARKLPADEAPPFSVSCRILPEKPSRQPAQPD